MTFMLRKNIIMKNKILPAVILLLLFSTKSFSQTTKANHGKSDTTSALHRTNLNKKRMIYQSTNTAKQSRYSNTVSATTYSTGKNSPAKTPALLAKKSQNKPINKHTRLGNIH